jgi:hypothetical protein
MILRYHKSKDPSKLGGFTVVRDDGSTEYQALPYAPGFMSHELTHFAAETQLGLRDSFLSLLARGHTLGQLAQTAENWTGVIPEEARQTEYLVGQFQAEFMGPAVTPLDAATFNQQLGDSCERAGLARPRPYADGELDRVRGALRALTEQWQAVALGGVMELRFEVPDGSLASA